MPDTTQNHFTSPSPPPNHLHHPHQKNHGEDNWQRTEIGMIPADWDVFDFGELINYIKGYPFKSSDYTDNGIRIIRVSDTTFDSIEDSGAVFVSEKVAKSYKKWELREFDLIFSTVGSKPPMYDSLVGKAILVTKKYSGSLLNQNAVLIREKSASPDLQKLFLNYFRTDRYIAFIEMIYRGNANQASITLEDLFKFKIPLPPTKAEQEAIAEALTDADALIASLEQLIAKKRSIKQGAMQTLLTGQQRLPGFEVKPGFKQTEVGMIPEDWEVSTLQEIVISGGLVRGPFGGALKKEYFVKQGYKVYEQRNAIYETVDKGNYSINASKYKELSRFSVQSGDLIISCSGTIGCIFKIPPNAPEGVINQALLKVTLNDKIIDIEFFLSIFRSLAFQERITENSHGGAMQNLVAMDVFKKTPIQLPTKAEQEAIAAILSDMDTEITTLEAKLTKARQLKQGMKQELLTGRIRLV